MNLNTVREIRQCFETEFAPILDKFVVRYLTIAQASDRKNSELAMPGAYVWWQERRGVVKVGRHLVNARKRAFEHISDNTGGAMADLPGDPGCRLLLFLARDVKDAHWVAAVEIYLERILKPEIRSKRTG